ncbi:hypothetical protein ACT4MW_06815 [Pseudomonas brassicacearum subsp. neoaurantiaca]|uniref:hypothetical protein n=1 Tax=Pseudomonas brassicacearum TaxID=930166 RepID=UPI003D659CE5
MIETFTEFDPAEYLSTPEAIAEFMRNARETGDTSYIDEAMEVVARAEKGTDHVFYLRNRTDNVICPRPPIETANQTLSFAPNSQPQF